MTEKQIKAAFLKYFKKYFRVITEVTSVSGKSRIDVVLIDKTNPNYVFGVELKKDDKKQGNKLAEWIKQAHRYSNEEFTIEGMTRKIPVLIYPAISNMFIQFTEKPIMVNNKEYYQAYHRQSHEHHNLNGIIGIFGIGEIRKVVRGVRPVYAFIVRNKIIWDEKRGTHKTNYK